MNSFSKSASHDSQSPPLQSYDLHNMHHNATLGDMSNIHLSYPDFTMPDAGDGLGIFPHSGTRFRRAGTPTLRLIYPPAFSAHPAAIFPPQQVHQRASWEGPAFNMPSLHTPIDDTEDFLSPAFWGRPDTGTLSSTNFTQTTSQPIPNFSRPRFLHSSSHGNLVTHTPLDPYATMPRGSTSGTDVHPASLWPPRSDSFAILEPDVLSNYSPRSRVATQADFHRRASTFSHPPSLSLGDPHSGTPSLTDAPPLPTAPPQYFESQFSPYLGHGTLDFGKADSFNMEGLWRDTTGGY